MKISIESTDELRGELRKWTGTDAETGEILVCWIPDWVEWQEHPQMHKPYPPPGPPIRTHKNPRRKRPAGIREPGPGPE